MSTEGRPAEGNSETSDTDAERQRERARRLRAALDGVELTPEITSDDAPESDDKDRDREFQANRPPHHG